jgi:xanthine dehydrogenase accessory factor
MKELADILAAFDALCAAGRPAALATVVGVEGSAYRRPGARMLVAADGRTWGGVSGGCLERDVARRARGVIETGRPVRCRYDTADDGAIAPGAATGCGGAVELFVQPVSRNQPGPLPHFAHAVRDRRPVTLCTLVHPAPSATAAAGDCVVGGDASLDAPAAFVLPPVPPGFARPRLVRSDVGEVFVERLLPPQALVVFGAGPDAVPLVAMAKLLGWHVTVVGSRPATGLAERFAGVDALHVTGSDEPTAGVPVPPDAAVVVMTHNVARDGAILAGLRGPVRYLGLLGPRHRTRKLLADLPDGRVRGVEPDRFHWPVGLDVGAETPEQIALSVVAEVQAALSGATGRPLRDRRGPVHSRRAGAAGSKGDPDDRAAAPDVAVDLQGDSEPWRPSCPA